MTSLKRLLNDEDDQPYPYHRPWLVSYDTADSGFYEADFNPSLEVQTWGATIQEDTFGFNYVNSELNCDDLDISAFLDTQADLEICAPGEANQISQDSESRVHDGQICYGTMYLTNEKIFHVAIKLCGDMPELDKRLNVPQTSPVPDHILLFLQKLDDHFLVTLSDQFPVGEVNASLEKALTNMNAQEYHLDFEVLAPTRAMRETIARAQKDKDAIIRVWINVYGQQQVASEVGAELSSHKMYLQRPYYTKVGTTYDNPHELKFEDSDIVSFEDTEIFEESAITKIPDASLEETISNVFSSLTRDKSLSSLEADDRLRTPLLSHQKTALDFMTQRENGPIPEPYCLWKEADVDGQQCYRHVVTNTICRLERPEETGGGILADEMGMGKSLSVLALILRTLDAASDWSLHMDAQLADEPVSWLSRPRSRATLIVASSDLMINEWFSELEKHFAPGTSSILKTIKYHGQKRESSIDQLRSANIIITTYHTLASELSGSKMTIRDVEWYRLVLDEAHIIRRQSTGLYKAVAGISARSRWCLSGTPIQNKLEDLGSLLAFLRMEPLHSLPSFCKFIVQPYEQGGKRKTLAIEKFRKLLDSLCLRRSRDLLHLPDLQNVTRHIQFTPEERHQYIQTQDTMFRAARHQHGAFDQKSTLGMFQVQLQLRILCNHGTWQQPFSWNRRKLHLLDKREFVEASLGRGGEATCSACRQVLPLFGAGAVFQRYSDCRHILCSECVDGQVTKDDDGVARRCPLCMPLWGRSTGTSQPDQVYQENTYFRASGISSKMAAVMKDVMVDMFTNKSIIFTCWTRTLDLIQIYLGHRHLDAQHFRRIDGDCPTAKRERILNDFAHDPTLRVLIMTTGTGAVGLNLATANRVFIVEPQWNPSVENQAIARALRLGQTQAVEVVRYVVEQTVELDMRSLQNTKMERANLVKGS